MVDESLIPIPRDRQSKPRRRPSWTKWKGKRTTCDACALLIGTQEASFSARAASWRHVEVDGRVSAYCTPHARSRGCREP